MKERVESSRTKMREREEREMEEIQLIKEERENMRGKLFNNNEEELRWRYEIKHRC